MVAHSAVRSSVCTRELDSTTIATHARDVSVMGHSGSSRSALYVWVEDARAKCG